MTGAAYEVSVSKTGFNVKSSVTGTGTSHAIGLDRMALKS
jgi:hypothetical protein